MREGIETAWTQIFETTFLCIAWIALIYRFVEKQTFPNLRNTLFSSFFHAMSRGTTDMVSFFHGEKLLILKAPASRDVQCFHRFIRRNLFDLSQFFCFVHDEYIRAKTVRPNEFV